MAVNQVGDGNTSEGVRMGVSGGKCGFYGTTPIAQPSVTQQTTKTTTALRADINRVEAALVALGLIAVT